MTHAELVDRAGKWLRYSCRLPAGREGMYHTFRCPVVFTEFATYAHEIPDAIGFADGGRSSFLIECKASRSDFLSDKTKAHRRVLPHCSMGKYRWYMAPSGLLNPEEMPEAWGLLAVEGRRIIVEKEAERQNHSREQEIMVLWSYCRRQQKGPKAAAINKEAGL